MFEFLRQLIEWFMCSGEGERGLTLVSQAPAEEEAQSGSHYIPTELFPDGCEVRHLEGDETFIENARQAICEVNPRRLFIFPPFIRFRNLSGELNREYPRMGAPEILMQISTEHLEPEAKLGMLLPPDVLTGRISSRFREQFFQHITPEYIIEINNRNRLFPEIHSHFVMQVFILSVGCRPSTPLKFFQAPEAINEEDLPGLWGDFERLVNQQGGETNYGYVRRDRIPPETPLMYSLHNPALQRTRTSLEHIGGVCRLDEIVELRRGLETDPRNSSLLLEGASGVGIPLLGGRNLQADGQFDLEETRYRIQGSERREVQLQEGDICVRGIVNPRQDHLAVSEPVRAEMLPLAVDRQIATLRPDTTMTEDDRAVLLAYLRSTTAMEFVRARMTQSNILPFDVLRSLPVPLADQALRNSLQSLRNARATFQAWSSEVEQAIDDLFRFEQIEEARPQFLSIGRRIRQRHLAARRTDDFSYRLRTQFPHPIAYRWRTIEASNPNLEGYTRILECTELTVCYLACLAIVANNVLENLNISTLADLAKRLSGKQRKGTNMGDWVAILRESASRRTLRSIDSSSPFYEVLSVLSDKEVDELLTSLMSRRNDLAHGRGPKGSAVARNFEQAFSELEAFLQATEFLSEYPLRFIEQTHRDSLRGITRYQYRELMGDHPLVPLAKSETPISELEAGSLYALDREGGLHLLRPLLTRQECPVCGNWETFFLDAYSGKEDVCTLKSMEHGHTLDDSDISFAFKHVGLLVEKD